MKKKAIKKTPEKYLTEKRFQNFENTFEENMRAIAKSFVDHAKAMDVMIKELKQIHDENKYFRSSISNLNLDGFSYDRKIENLTVRVEKLEAKAK